jgi:hypothetical protein
MRDATREITTVQDVEVGFDENFINKWMKNQKYAWMFVGLTVATGLSGLLGRGPLANAKASNAGLTVTYERIARNKTPAMMEVQLPIGLASDTVRLHLEGDLVRRGRFERIVPQPTKSQPLKEGVVAEMVMAKTSEAGKVTLVQQPSSPGKLRHKIFIEGGPSVEFDQIVLP